MLEQKRELVQQHIKTHTERSEEDVAAVNTLNSFLYAEGKINTDFSSNDKWPNHDGTLEFVPDPDLDRRPKQYFSHPVGCDIAHQGSHPMESIHRSALPEPASGDSENAGKAEFKLW